jgi:type IV pilus assembly protein PilB
MATFAEPPLDAPRPALGFQPRRRLGEMLVAQGVLSEEQLREVLVRQKSHKGVRLGRLLTDLGYVSDILLADVVADQLRLPTVDLAGLTISADAIARLPREIALRTRCLPWRIEGRDIHVITSDPTDVHALDQVAFKTGLRVKPVVAPEGDLLVALDRYYSSEETASFTSVETLALADQLAIVDNIDEETPDGEDDLSGAAHAAPVIRLVNAILADAIRVGASDIHIEPQQKGVTLRYRVDGTLRHVITMPKRSQAKVVSRVKIAAHMDIAERRKPQDGRTRIVVGGQAFDLRVSTLPTADGEKVVIRILAQDRAHIALEDLGFAPELLAAFKDLLHQPQGLILVTGPTGSGKTSTLYGALNHLVSEATNIVTVEDPIEYRIAGVNQVAVSERSGLTFALGLRSILRQDPDIVMVGEIRDLETAQVAFQAAQTGHLVLATLHTNDAPSTVTRLVDMGVPAYLVATSVIGVLAQRLVRRVCTCGIKSDDGLVVAAGCDTCGHTGYRGRVAVHELLVMTPAVRNAVRGHAVTDELRRLASGQALRTLHADSLAKVRTGITTAEEIRRVVPAPAAEPAGSVAVTISWA